MGMKVVAVAVAAALCVGSAARAEFEVINGRVIDGYVDGTVPDGYDYKSPLMGAQIDQEEQAMLDIMEERDYNKFPVNLAKALAIFLATIIVGKMLLLLFSGTFVLVFAWLMSKIAAAFARSVGWSRRVEEEEYTEE